jgi:sugar phosphate isomerase/epimerase
LQAGELLDRIDEPNVFVHLDTYHMNIEEKGFYEPIVSLGSRLGYIHLSESDRGTRQGRPTFTGTRCSAALRTSTTVARSRWNPSPP